MSIDIKCNSCSSKYSVADRFAGGSVKCSKCHAPIHVPIVPRQPPLTTAPTAADAAADAADLSFDYTPSLAPPTLASATAVQPMAAPAPSGNAPQPEAADEPALEASPAEDAGRRPRRLRFAWLKFPFRRLGGSLSAGARPARNLSSEYQIRNYWTAWLAPSLWVFSGVAGLGLAMLAVRRLLSLGSIPADLQQSALWSGVAQIAGVVFGLIVVRISLETVSVLFEIAQTLREVRDELRNRE